MLVTGDRFFDTVQLLASTPEVAVDTETTSLYPFKDGKLFSVIFATATDEYYFNFQNYQDETTPEMVLSRALIPYFAKIFQSPGVLYGHNLIFDLQFLAKEGLKEFNRDLWCTEVGARLEYNDHLQYSLAACAKRIGLEKDDGVKDYLDKNKLYTRERDPGKKSTRKNYHFDRVPLSIVRPYAETDARVCFQLAQSQRKTFREYDASSIGAPSINRVAENERKLTRVLFKMQRTGVRLDIPYAKQALAYEQERAESAKREFTALTGENFVDSAKSLERHLVAVGVPLGRTEKGALSVADEVLSPHAGNGIVDAVLRHRDAQKRANTFWNNYLQLVGSDGRIHAWLRQGGAATGRFSSREPNMQQVPKGEDSPFPVRRAFIPEDGELMVSLDFQAQEFRVLLDYSGQADLIEKVQAGLDVHTSTAELMGIPRKQAKTVGFSILYGSGIATLASQLGMPDHVAKELKYRFYERLPKVREFVFDVTNTAKRRGYIFTWMGRRLHIPNPDFAYKAVNWLIQGSCADITKKAMNDVDELLLSTGSKIKMTLSVHDELVLSVPRREVDKLEDIMRIMCAAYPHKRLPLAASCSWSEKNWGEMSEGLPNG